MIFYRADAAVDAPREFGRHWVRPPIVFLRHAYPPPSRCCACSIGWIQSQRRHPHGINPPQSWRAHAYAIDAFPILNELTPEMPSLSSAQVVAEPGHLFLARQLRQAEGPVTVLLTGPITNLAAALQAEPELSAKIEECCGWAARWLCPATSAIRAHGTGRVECYWDPLSPITVANEVPIPSFPWMPPITFTFLWIFCINCPQLRYPSLPGRAVLV
jgi:hypothetical protein